MELHGTLGANLQNAISSAERLRGHPVYPDTLKYWTELLHEARRTRSEISEPERVVIDRLIARLETIMSERDR